MISSRTVKILSGEWARQRDLAMKDKTSFTQAELDHLDITGSQGGGVYNDDTFLLDTTPLDPSTPARSNAIDIRDESGGP